MTSIPPYWAGLAVAGVASLALMAVVTEQLGRAALAGVPTVLLVIVGAALLVRWKVNSTWLVLCGAAPGWALHAVGGDVGLGIAE